MMAVDDLRNNGQAKSDAGFLRRHKRIKNLLLQLSRDPRAGIRDAHFDAFDRAALSRSGLGSFDADLQLAAGGTSAVDPSQIE